MQVGCSWSWFPASGHRPGVNGTCGMLEGMNRRTARAGWHEVGAIQSRGCRRESVGAHKSWFLVREKDGKPVGYC